MLTEWLRQCVLLDYWSRKAFQDCSPLPGGNDSKQERAHHMSRGVLIDTVIYEMNARIGHPIDFFPQSYLVPERKTGKTNTQSKLVIKKAGDRYGKKK